MGIMALGYKNRTAQFELIIRGLINQDFRHATRLFWGVKVSQTLGQIMWGMEPK